MTVVGKALTFIRGTLSRRWRVILAGASGVVGVFGILGWMAFSPAGAGRADAHDAGITAPAPPPVTVSIADEQDGRVPWDRPLRVHVADGTLRAVTVDEESGAAVGGAPDGLSDWSTATTLTPLTHYVIRVDTVDGAHRPLSQVLSVQAADSAKHLIATVSPGDGEVVGVGMPVAVTFNADVPVAQRPAVASRLAVGTDPAVDGAWHWMSAREVHWRPAAYWKAGTKVDVHTDLGRLDLGGGLWGSGTRTVNFSIGDAHVSTADVAAHTFTVTSNGQTVKVVSMSAGRDAYPTKGGVHIALEKAQVVTMDSQTVGIPRDSPDGYYEQVFWDVRISNGGAFVHAAPWSVNDQGHRNVSHGCVNLSTADAQWFYNFSRRGDVVNVINSNTPPVLSDPGMADWNIPWETWRQG